MTTTNDPNARGSFASGFGFLMASVGAAVGLGNLWGFPYKMGTNGGFAFILIYLILIVFLGFPLMLSEIALGRKTRKSAIGAFHEADPRFTIAGVFETLVPFFLLCFYCVLGGIVTRYLIGNLGDIFGASWGINGKYSASFYNGVIMHPGVSIPWKLIFLTVTSFIEIRGVQGGIEKFASIAMPCLFVLLIFTAVRCCSLPGAANGIEFMFKPDFSVFKGTGWFRVFANAGAQMFFSLSLAAGCIITFGSYLDKDDNVERQGFMVPILDTIAALLAGMCVLPAVFAAGIEPSSGPGLLFVSLQRVFQSMGKSGPVFGFVFYLLVFIAALTSSIGMMEGGISVLNDSRLKKGKPANRPLNTAIAIGTTLIGGLLVAIDQLGENASFWKPFGQPSWLNVFDLLSEGILMPLGCLLMAVMLGWTRRHYLDDEIEQGSQYRTKPFVNFCLRWIAPVLMAFILFIQISTFFFSDTAWFKNLIG